MANASRKVLFQTGLTETRTTDVEGKGSVREDRFGNKYRRVYNLSAFDARVGAPACFDATLYNNTNFLKNVLSAPTAEDVNFLAGVYISAIPTLNYGWIMIMGMYGSSRVALASGGSFAINDTALASTLTDTTGTAAIRPYSFLNGVIASGPPNSSLPTYPTNKQSPLSTIEGSGLRAGLITKREIISGVWPGVCITRKITCPIVILSPSRSLWNAKVTSAASCK